MWNRTGAVTVAQGSAVVIGEGTRFLDEKRGWEFVVDGDASRHEIRRIVSDTELELYEEIERVDGSGLSFVIIPTQGLEVDIRDRLVQAVSVFEGVQSDFAMGFLALWVTQPGNEGKGFGDLLLELVGPAGGSAYQVWLDEGNAGTPADFLDHISNGAVTATAANLAAASAAQAATETARDAAITKANEAAIDAASALASEVSASASSASAAMQAIAAGAPIAVDTSAGIASTANDDVFLVPFEGGLIIYENDNGSPLEVGKLFSRSKELSDFAELQAVPQDRVDVGQSVSDSDTGGRFTRAPDTATDAPYDYTAGGGAKWYINKRPKFRLDQIAGGLIYPDTPLNSTVGIAGALAYLGQEGGGSVTFPRQAEFIGKIANVPDNIEIDFNGSKLTPVGATDVCVDVSGTQGTPIALNTGAAMGDILLKLNGFIAAGGGVGSWIWVYDNSSRLSDSDVDINNSIHQVMAVEAGSPADTVYLDRPLSFKKDAVGTGRKNVTILSMKTGVKLLNLHTEPPANSTYGVGILARWCDDMEVHNRMHTEGAGGTGNSFRACASVQGSNFTTKDVRVAGTYGLAISQGSFNVSIDGVLGVGDRHTVDMDTCDYCTVTGAISKLGTSAPFGMAHNGVGGSNNTIEGTVYVEGQNYAFNARGFHEVTGQGSSEVTFPMLAPTVKIKAVQARDKGTTLNTGVYFRMPIVDANVEVDLRNGDGTLDTLNSTAVRLYPYRSSGKVKVRSRGYTRAVFADVHDISTQRGHVLELDIDCDNGKQALYSRGGDGYKLSVNAGPGMVPDYDATLRPDETLLRFEETEVGKRVRYLEIAKLVTSLADAEKDLIGITNPQGYAAGSIGVIDTNVAHNTLTVGTDFTLTRGRILAAGSKAVRIDGTAACKITEIEKGLFFGQEVQLWSTTEGTFPVTIEAFATTNYLGDVTRTLGYAPVSMRWDGSRWRPLVL